MKKYNVILENVDDKKLENIFVHKLSFPEAAMSAYMALNKLGFEWKIKSITEVGNKTHSKDK